MKLLRLAVFAALALALAQALLIGRVELSFDEAYYVMWARWPQAGYLDHPPWVAWQILASQKLFGDREFGVRALFWLEGVALPALVGWIGWRLFADGKTAAVAALLFVAAPLAAGAPLATPDTPLVFFWTLALLGLVEVYRGHEAAWALVGLAAGAAGLAKMTAGFLAAGVVLALAATPSLRRQWRRPGLWLAAALALVVLSPFLLWNGEHGMATFFKQGARLAAPRWAPRYLAEFLGAQALLINPATAAAGALALSRARGASARSEPVRLLLATIAPALLYFILHALHDRVQANWPAPLYPAILLLVARGVAVTPALRWAPYAAIALGGVAVAAAYMHLVTGEPAIGASDPFARIGGWRALSERVFAVAEARHAPFVLAHGYAATSLLTFYGPGRPPVVEAEEPERWTFRPPVNTLGEGLAFGPPNFAETLTLRYRRVEIVESFNRRVGAATLEPYTLFAVADPRGVGQ